MIGSFLTYILFGILFINYFKNIYYYKVDVSNNFILLILFLSLVSQIGDLIVSYFKRISKLDNTGKLIPGHGGILDRIDGIIFVVPTFYILNYFFTIL